MAELADSASILIAEDHAILRDGLKSIFAMELDLEVVGEANDGQEAVRLARELEPDLVLLDLSMPRLNGLEALKEIKRLGRGTRVIILTMNRTEEYVFAAFQAGADGYLLKSASSTELLLAVRSVLAGNRCLSPQISAAVIEGYLGSGAPRPAPSGCPELRPRQVEVLTLLAQGYKNREIAERLFISEKTVEKHRSNVMQKLGLTTVPALTAYAIERGLVTP